LKFIKPEEVHLSIDVVIHEGYVTWVFYGIFAVAHPPYGRRLLKEHVFLPDMTHRMQPKGWVDTASGVYHEEAVHAAEALPQGRWVHSDDPNLLHRAALPCCLRLLLGKRLRGELVMEEVALTPYRTWQYPSLGFDAYSDQGHVQVARLSAPEIREVFCVLDHPSPSQQKDEAQLRDLLRERIGPDRALFVLKNEALLPGPSGANPGGHHAYFA
jgi:hypothetical protein